jgi:hypothetical protein
MDVGLEIEGWYQDPYRLHTERWFSAGVATDLVRDGDVESRDPAPAAAYDGPLVESDEVTVPDETVRAGDAPAGTTEVTFGLASMSQGSDPLHDTPPPSEW